MKIFYDEYTEAFRVFKTNGVHGEDWRNPTYAVVMYTRDGKLRCVRAKSEGGDHVEDYFTGYFENLLRENISPSTIKMFVSNSPCAKCSQNIIRFSQLSGWKFEIVVSALYNIWRPSCVRNPSCYWHVDLVSPDIHDANVRGLGNLSTASRVTLSTFNAQDWKDLGILLGVPPATDYGRPEEEDDLLWNDFEELMIDLA